MRKAKLLIAIVALALTASPAMADEGLLRTTWPSAEDPGIPAYTEIEPAQPHFINDGEWVAVVFYRDPSCVRSDFNLLQFFDIPIVFGCPLTMEGFSLWAGEPLVGAPKILTLQGSGAVPIWFAPLESFQAAAADGELYIAELAAAEGLVRGTASQFSGTLLPRPLPPELGGGGHPVGGQSMAARGTLDDGGSFNLQFSKGTTVINISSG